MKRTMSGFGLLICLLCVQSHGWTAASGKRHLGDDIRDRFDPVNDSGEAGLQTDA